VLYLGKMLWNIVSNKLRRTQMQEVVTWFDTNVTEYAWKTGYNHETLARIDKMQAKNITQKPLVKK